IMISGPALAARRRDEAESELREAFQTDPNTARPSLLIVDDIDYLTPTRDSPAAAASLLGLMQELLDQPGRPVVIATTSRPDEIDPAIRRLGRIGRQVPLPLPAEVDRRAILTVHTRDLALAVDQDAERAELLDDLA